MPELPEVETIKRGLVKRIVGKTITGVEALHPKSWQGDKNRVIGRKVVAVERRAKILLIQLHGREVGLIIHLKMTGQLVYKLKITNEKSKIAIKNSKLAKAKKSPYDAVELPNKYTRVVIKFSDDSVLFFNDLRLFGWIKVINVKDLSRELENFSGIEPLDKGFTVDYLTQVFSASKRSIKLVLMDQKKIAGIGNIYANEALFCAKIDPRRPANKATPEQLNKLRNCIVKVLEKGIKYNGTTSSDEAFRNLDGERGQMQQHLLVYGKVGDACSVCGQPIKRIKLGGRGTFFCPHCQQ